MKFIHKINLMNIEVFNNNAWYRKKQFSYINVIYFNNPRENRALR